MANYITSSGFSDLNGSMVATNNNVDSYYSNNLGNGSVRNTGGSGLAFTVSFGATPPRVYHINANPGGNGFNGSANNNGPMESEETWSATASTGVPAEKKKSAY
jgi:hypothetical protein